MTFSRCEFLISDFRFEDRTFDELVLSSSRKSKTAIRNHLRHFPRVMMNKQTAPTTRAVITMPFCFLKNLLQ